ncbi:MAG: bifunctional DNA-formamidopyrimidine glycosylase/DNA-(apurinic or apyrimidinic site) lyase [Anaerolineales bacterium]|nr:bifunctional DNA-formamidopyrimidine glycosylase/DNA-(apurinic or apyrimidinic site) lyase [Anaerolineales bacterium]
MPELPEVETICRLLRQGSNNHPTLTGMRIRSADLLWERTLAEPTPLEFQHRLPGQQILDINRRGKFLVFRLTDDHLILHLRMSGDLVIEPQEAPIPAHHRLILYLQGEPLRLAFNDTRKFGRVWLTAHPNQVLGRLGPEPLEPSFTADHLYQRLQRTRRQIKPLLLDQSFLAGLGNIYTDEALHLAKIHPLTPANLINPERAEQLWSAIRHVLQEGIRRNGASIDWVYRGGDFQNYFRVYQRTGQPCPECGALIERTLVGQRGTHCCPVCQSLPALNLRKE